MTGLLATLRLALGGIAYRRSTAVIVLLLAVVASTAAVVAPLYSRAAEESIARGALARSDQFARAVHVDVSTNAALQSAAPQADEAVAIVEEQLRSPAFQRPMVVRATEGLAQPTSGPQASGRVVVPVAERSSLCDHLKVTEGRCPTGADEVAVTTRSLELLGLRVGDHVSLTFPDLANAVSGQRAGTLTVVGSYRPFDLDDPYWLGRQIFGYVPHERPQGLGELPPMSDTLLAGPGFADRVGLPAYALDVPVDPRALDLDSAPVAAAQVAELAKGLGLRGALVTSQLPVLVDRATERSAVVRVAAPLAAVQLVLLAWVILAHVVGSATQERAPELGLAKLRGLSPGRTVRFGLAEVVLLLLVAAPLGTLLGWLVVRLAAEHLFEAGTGVHLTRWVVASVLLGVVGGIGAAAVAAHGVARQHVAELLRRVPGAAAGRRAGVAEGAVLALVVAGVVQLALTRDETPGPVAMAAPGMIALGGALLAARALRLLARRRTVRSLDAGRPAAVLGWAGVLRRAGVARTTGVLTAAIALLLIGVQAWSVASRERAVRATAETGAAVVLDVDATSPTALRDAVRRADPGADAMAVVRLPGGDTNPTVLAVDGTRAAHVLAFGHQRPDHLTAALDPRLPDPLTVRPGVVEVGLQVRSVSSPSPLTASVTVARPTSSTEAPAAAQTPAASSWVELPLGELRAGDRTYRAEVPSWCSDGCRLVGLALQHPGTDIASATADLTVTSIATGPVAQVTPLTTAFDDPHAWRPGVPDLGAALVDVTPGRQLKVTVSAPGGVPARVVHGDAPEPLPGLVAPGTAARDGLVQAVGLDGGLLRVARTSPVAFVPGLGSSGAIVDLDLALRGTARTGNGDLQVWLDRDDPVFERSLTTALRHDGVTVTGRTAAQSEQSALAKDGAVLSLLLFVACGGVALIVSAGAMLVAAFVGGRQRATEAAGLRVVGVRRLVVRRGLLIENLAGVGVALVGGAVAAVVAARVVLPVLPLFDQPSEYVGVSAAPDLPVGLWTLLAVAAVLATLAVVVASGQLRGGTVDRIREGTR
ncbi:MAG TPA: FtsX-like permease family protein [Actinomycetales bacterium]|nr:FtsX-like permease family protein [Actinomycetales bacterium]